MQNIIRHEDEMWWFRGMRRITVSLLDPLVRGLAQPSIFEGGSGTGSFAAMTASRYGAQVFAAELDTAGVAMCARRPGVLAAQADLRQIPYASRRFDAALLLDVLSHIPRGEEGTVLRELWRILRPGGHLVVRTSALGVFRSNHSRFIWEQQRFSRGRLRRAASAAGFRVVRTTYANMLLSPIALAKFRILEPLLKTPAATGLERLPSPVETLFFRALAVEDWFLRKGIDLPFGQSLFLVARKPMPPYPETQ